MISKASDEESGRKLWELSCDFVGLEKDLRLDEYYL
jgi:hypothetical protein